MIIRHSRNLELHSNFNMSFDTWRAKHAEAWLELETGIDPSVLHQLIPRLAWVLVGSDWVDIGNLASKTAAHYIEVEAVLALADLQSLPPVLNPRRASADDNVWPEALNTDLIFSSLSEAVVELVHTRHRSYLTTVSHQLLFQIPCRIESV